VRVANGAGLPTVALLTDMSEPLATSAGNALEVRAAIDFLTGARIDPRLWEVTVALAAEMLVLGRLAADIASGRSMIEDAYRSGRAAERFAAMVVALGGPSDLLDHPARHLAVAPVVKPVHPTANGHVAAIDTRAIGVAVVALGGGRTRATDPIDPSVGYTDLAGLGDAVDGERPLGVVHARTESDAEAAAAALRSAYRIGTPGVRGPAVIERAT
jgi:thymidine phosphorylase